MPVEFSVAAYRLGHSMIRPGYRLNDDDTTLLPIFPIPPNTIKDIPAGIPDGLTGFQAMAKNRGIDWGRIIDLDGDIRAYGGDPDAINPPDADMKHRLQFAYRIDTSLVTPLSVLPSSIAGDPPPSLPQRNLLRGFELGLPTGQSVAKAMKITPLTDDQIIIGKAVDNPSGDDVVGKLADLPELAPFRGKCPLWTYILAEAANNRTNLNIPVTPAMKISTPQLGPVGGRIVPRSSSECCLETTTRSSVPNPIGFVNGTLTVGKATLGQNGIAGITLAASATSVASGQSVTFTATVPVGVTGTATFMDGTTVLGTGTISGATVTLTTNTLAVGTHSVTAVCGGDTNYNSAISAPISVSVTVASIVSVPTVTVGSSSPTAGQPVTVTVTVPTVGNTPPTGTVTIYDNGNPIGTGTLGPDGTVTVNIPGGLPAGSNNITVGYSGGGLYSGSTSAAVPVSVSTLDFTLTRTSAESQTIVTGEAATITVQVAPTSGTYPGNVSITATGLPAGATATFTPATVAANGGTASVHLNLQTAPLVSVNRLGHAASIALGLLLLPFLGAKRRRLIGSGQAGGRYLFMVLVLLACRDHGWPHWLR